MISINGKIPSTTEICNYILTRKNEGNSGYVVLWDTNEFQPYDLVEITQDQTHQFIVDKVKTLDKSVDVKKQEIFLQDTIHYFDKVTPPSRQFSNNKTVEEVLDIYSVNEKNNPVFEYTYSYLLEAIMPQKEYDGENLSTILKDLGKRINAKVNVEIRDSQPPLVTFTPLAQRVGTTAIDNSNVEHYQTEYDSTNYATQVLGKVKNAIIEDGRGTWFPSKNYGVTPRTDEFRFDEATAAYILNDKIWTVLQVIIPEALDNVSDGTNTFSVDFDVTAWVVSKPKWDFLNNPTSADTQSATVIDQANTVYYQIGGDRIEKLWDTFAGLGNREHLANLYQSAILKYVADNPTHTIGAAPYKYEDDIFDIPFIINYVSQRDVDYLVEKMSIKNKYQATLLSNQLSTLVELNQHASAMSLLAERVANKEITYKETTSGTLVRLGNWTTDNRIVTTVKREIDGTETKQTIEVSKNFANIDVETSVSRSPDPFQITSKQITTNFLSKEYIEFSTSPKAVDSYMDATARRVAINIFDYSVTYDNPIFDGQIIPTIPIFIGGDYDGKAIHVPAMTFADNTIGFHVHLFHPTFAGYTLLDNRRGVIEYKRELNGEIQDLATYDMQFGTENVIDDSGTNRLYPLVTETTGTIDIGTVYANLDPNCLLAHTHNIHIVTDAPEEIILNGNFGFYNNLIRVLDNPSLEVYYSQNIFEVFTTADKKKRSGDIVYTTGTISFNHTLRELTVTHPNTVDNIAIVLGDDIILALNGIDTCYVNYGKIRSGLKGLVYYEGTSFGTFGFTGAASGSITAISYYGTAQSETISFTGTASGGLSFIEYTGTALGNISFVGTASGTYEAIATYEGTSSGTISFEGTASGEMTIENLEGTATGTISFNGTATGSFVPSSIDYEGTAHGTIGFTGTAEGEYTYPVWDYIGTSGTPDVQQTLVANDDVCRTSDEVKTLISSIYPAENYSVSTVMKINHSRIIYSPPFDPVEEDCTAFYYRSIEVTI